MSFSKFFAAAACSVALSASALASVVNVGGVVWDTNAVNIADSDFTGRFSFNQFYTTAANAVANSAGAAPSYAFAKSPVSLGVGDVLQGAGEVNSFNGVTLDPNAAGGGFCSSCELTFIFGGFAVQPGLTSLSNGWLRIYVDGSPDFALATETDLTKASDGTLFLELTAVNNVFSATGGNGLLQGSLDILFDVTGGIAASYFDTNTALAGADLVSSSSASFFGPLGATRSIATATGEIYGDTVPVSEPGILALLGMGLIGAAVMRLRRG